MLLDVSIALRFASCFALAGFVCSCEAELVVRGSVHRGEGEPVANATVQTVCSPNDSTDGEISTMTDASGEFEATGTGTIDDDCVIQVITASEPRHEFRALDYCTDKSAQHCTTIEAHLTISPDGSS